MTTTIGSDLERVGARDKVTGATHFAADHPRAGLAYAMFVTASIGKGRITRIDTSAAEKTPGVLLVLTHETMDRLPSPGFIFGGGCGFQSFVPMQDDRVAYRGQPIALVVADSLESASEAAALVKPEYEETPFSVTLDAPGAEDVLQAQAMPVADPVVGDAEAAIAGAEVAVEAVYLEAPQHQNPMELLATVAEWEDGKLIVHDTTQNTESLRNGLSRELGIDPASVRVESHYAGGAFGQKTGLCACTTFAAVAARRLGRPVKIFVPREQTFYDAPFRPAIRQRVKLGADRSGHIVGAIHETWQQTSRHDLFGTLGSEMTSRLYDLRNFRGINHLVRTDVQTPGFMRAPWESPAAFAFESAVDELASALNRDPVELRLANDGQVDPITGKPFSSRHVAECLTRGAARFGWSKRDPRPGSMREANGDLLGWGVALGAYPGLVVPAEAHVRVHTDGSVDVSVGGHEMGQGLRTAVTLTVADRLGVDPANVRLTVGDTIAPPQHNTAGSWGTASACWAVHDACTALLDKLFALAGPDHAAVDQRPSAATIADILDSVGRDFIEASARRVGPGQTAEAFERASHGAMAFAGPVFPDFVAYSFSAHFVEVAVHPETYQIRVPRAVSVVDCGKVVSARTARSQVLGGLVWGIGASLREATDVDPRFGGFLNANIAEYHVPVNADVGDYTVEFVDAPDYTFNPIGSKGLGEVALAGVAAAIANAVYHATGRRLRRLPIRLEDFHSVSV
jgi:xanthine dehydrogenase YagR molybdenum-binding subunit